MYGMVNRAIEDLVVSTAGVEVWQKIVAVAELESSQFSDSENYDDDITFRLVEAASTVTGQPTDVILEAFGRHWILFTGRDDWACLFEASPGDLYEFLSELDSLHARVQTAMPNMRMPQFTVIDTEDEDGSVIVEYRSTRTGLTPMVSGLLTGMAEYFNENIDIEQIGWRCDDGYDSFKMKKTNTERHGEEAANAA